MNQEPLAAVNTDMTTAPAAAEPPGATAKGIVYGLLGLGIPFALLVVWMMAVSSASATGGCGGG